MCLGIQVFGTQNWGRRDFKDYTGPGWQAFEIPVGRFYTGFFDYLVLIADKDSTGASQDSSFRNLSIREASNKTILTNRGITFRVRGK